MKKIRFDISMRPQIESGEYQVVMRDSDKPVRIICWNADPKYPVCYLEKIASQTLPVMVGSNGSFYENPGDADEQESRADLFVLVPDTNEDTKENMMTPHQIDLLSREIGSRIHYGLKVCCPKSSPYPEIVDSIDYSDESEPFVTLKSGLCYFVSYVKPYLRPLSSMTESEWSELDEELIQAGGVGYDHKYNDTTAIIWIDFMLRHHFDYRGLIDMGLAIASPLGYV